MRYFRKAIVANTIKCSDGKVMQFVPLGGGDGVIATEDPTCIAELEARIRERRGGITELTQPAYEEALKKKSVMPLPQQSRQVLSAQTVNLVSPSPQTSAAPVAVAADPEPKEPQSPRPTVGRPRRKS